MATVAGTVPPMPIPTNNGQPPPSTQSSQTVRLNTIEIAVIATGSSLLVLALTILICLLLVRARKRRQRQTVPTSRTLGATEKYGGLEYTPFEFPSENHIFRDHGGTAPLLNIPIRRDIPHDRMSPQQSYISSQNDNETRHFLVDDGLSSLFVSGEDEITQVPLSHAISLADAIPYAQPEESYMDSTLFLSPTSRSTPTKHLPALPSLIIPADVAPPTRRSSRRKPSKHGSGYHSDDSASMYSQASASSKAPARSFSVDCEVPVLLAGPLIPHSSTTSDFRPLPTQQIPSSPEVPSLHVVLAPEEDAEEKQIARENTVLVAKLLKSRIKHTSGEPWRNSSIISHIERSGSIKPPLGDEEDEPRGTRHLRKLRGRRSNMPTLSSTAMAESVLQELEGPALEEPALEEATRPGMSSS